MYIHIENVLYVTLWVGLTRNIDGPALYHSLLYKVLLAI